MKKCLFILFFIPLFLTAQTLPLSPQGEKEAQLYLDYLQGAFAEISNDPDYCKYYKKAFLRAPGSKLLRRTLMLCAIEKDNLKEAEQYADYIKKGENDARDWAVYAFYHWRKGNLKEAQEYYEKALALDPDDVQVLYQYILLLTYVDLDRAVEQLEQRRANYPGMSHVIFYEIGNIYVSKKQYPQALQYFQKALDEDPTYAPAYLARADIFEKHSQFFLMLHELEELEKTGFENDIVYGKMGSIFIIVKDFPRAKEYFIKAKKLNNANIPAGYFLALFAEREKDYAAAIGFLQDTEDYPQDPGKWLQVSFYQQKLNLPQEALRTLKKAYKKFDDNVEIGYFYALLLQDQKKYRQAKNILKKILSTNPQYENAQLAYAYALESLGRYQEMEEQLLLLLDKNPKNAAAYNLLGFSLAERGVRLDQAQEYITKALSLSPDDRSFIDSLAWVYYQKGEYAKALDLLKSIDEDFIQTHKDIAYHLGATYFKMGLYEQAYLYLNIAAPEIKPARKALKKLLRQQPGLRG